VIAEEVRQREVRAGRQAQAGNGYEKVKEGFHGESAGALNDHRAMVFLKPLRKDSITRRIGWSWKHAMDTKRKPRPHARRRAWVEMDAIV
jgi:hypothetical protein